MSAALDHLKDREWSMGHGQCPECCGMTDDKSIADWHHQDEKLRDMADRMRVANGDPPADRPIDYQALGHKQGCKLKAAIDDCVRSGND